MRTSQIMAILLIMCFTFAGASALAVDKEIKVKKGNKEITVTVDDSNYNLKNVKVKDGTMAEEDFTSGANERHGSDVTELRIKRKRGPAEDIQFVTEGTVILSGTGTCVWYFSMSQWHQYCW